MTETHDPAQSAAADLVVAVLEDMKAERISRLEVHHLTTITETMVVATGRSDRHVRAISDELLGCCAEEGRKPIGVEGAERGEWVLVDLGDVVVHIMLEHVRDFYDIEKLWDIARARDGARGG